MWRPAGRKPCLYSNLGSESQRKEHSSITKIKQLPDTSSRSKTQTAIAKLLSSTLWTPRLTACGRSSRSTGGLRGKTLTPLAVGCLSTEIRKTRTKLTTAAWNHHCKITTSSEWRRLRRPRWWIHRSSSRPTAPKSSRSRPTPFSSPNRKCWGASTLTRASDFKIIKQKKSVVNH